MRNEPPVLRALGTAIDWAVIAAGAGVILLVFYSVLSRFLLKTDVAWSSDLCTLLLIWLTFVGGAMAVRRNAHLQVTEFIMGLPLPAKARMDAVVLAISAFVLAILVYFGITLTQRSWGAVAVTIKISNGWWYLAMPVGCALMLVFVLHQLWAVVRQKQPLDRVLGRD